MKATKQDNNDKRTQILVAARKCFLIYGYKRTVMEDIARIAQVSRPALYLQFENKEAIFRTLIEQIHTDALNTAKAALQSKKPIHDRLQLAFKSRFVDPLKLAQVGEHGDELFEIQHGVATDIAREVESQFQALLIQTIEEAAARGELDLARLGWSAEDSALLLIQAARGLKSHPREMAHYQQRLQQLIQLFSVAARAEAQ